MVKMTKSKTFQAYLPNCHRTYSCIHCRAHLANHDELISKGERGLRARRGEGPADRAARGGGHLLRELQDHARLEI
ncbi:protein yippee-like 1, partial [Daubentonia madagascariensis]